MFGILYILLPNFCVGVVLFYFNVNCPLVFFQKGANASAWIDYFYTQLSGHLSALTDRTRLTLLKTMAEIAMTQNEQLPATLWRRVLSATYDLFKVCHMCIELIIA